MMMGNWLHRIETRAPSIKEERFVLVRERLADTLAALGTGLDDSRFLQEIVIMADKLDVSEELTRSMPIWNACAISLKSGPTPDAP